MTASPLAPSLVGLDQGSIVTKAFLRAAEELGVTAKGLAPVIGESEATLSRMKNYGFVIAPGTKAFEVAVLFVRLFRLLDAIADGDPQVARAWLSTANEALEGRPVDKIQTIAGLLDVIAYLDTRSLHGLQTGFA